LKDSSICNNNIFSIIACYKRGINSQQQPSNKFIVDSGATERMTGTKEVLSNIIMFLPLLSTKCMVILGDEIRTLEAKGKGTLDIIVHNKHLWLYNALYASGLQGTLLSVKEHIKWKECAFHRVDNVFTLSYPNNIILTSDTQNELMIHVSSGKYSNRPVDFEITIKTEESYHPVLA